MSTSLSVVIVNWNTRDLLRDCLGSIRSTVGLRDVEVFVVDNGSSDGSLEMIRDEFPGVCLIENAQNVGFAKANNQAIPLCRGRYVMLLNSDAVVLPGAVEGLMEFMELHPETAAVGPRLIDSEGRPAIAAGYLPTLGTVFNHFFFLSWLWPAVFRGLSVLPSFLDSKPLQLEWLTGACLMVRRDVFNKVGLLSEEYFMYAEDMELCERMKRAGYKLYYVPTVQVTHVGGASSRNLPVEASTRWLTSLHLFYARRRSRAAVVAFDLIHGLGLAIRALVYACLSLRPGGSDRRRHARVVGASSVKAFGLAWRTLLGSNGADGSRLR